MLLIMLTNKPLDTNTIIFTQFNLLSLRKLNFLRIRKRIREFYNNITTTHTY